MSPIVETTVAINSVVETVANDTLNTQPAFHRHPLFSFDDGNVAIITSSCYFLVHRGFLSRHSSVFATAFFDLLQDASMPLMENLPALKVQDSPEDMYHFLVAYYDGASNVTADISSFPVVSSVLRLSTKYQVNSLRRDLLSILSNVWPSNLAQWDQRESIAADGNGGYNPRHIFPHPVVIIDLARAVNAPELLPSTFYDLSRCPPSYAASGYQLPGCNILRLSQEDTITLLKGREHASRYLSTFIVGQLEGRAPAADCVHHKDTDTQPSRRACQAAFEAITFEILRDANSTVSDHSSDPLFTIKDAELMQSRPYEYGGQQVFLRPCGPCQREFSDAVNMAREEFWRHLPQWFGLETLEWG